MKSDTNFDSELRLRMPEGFQPAAVQLYDLHEDRLRGVGYTAENGILRVPLHVTARAAWLVIAPTGKVGESTLE